MKIGFAQLNPIVGDLSGNFEKIVSAYEHLAAAGLTVRLPRLPGHGTTWREMNLAKRVAAKAA